MIFKSDTYGPLFSLDLDHLLLHSQLNRFNQLIESNYPSWSRVININKADEMKDIGKK